MKQEAFNGVFCSAFICFYLIPLMAYAGCDSLDAQLLIREEWKLRDYVFTMELRPKVNLMVTVFLFTFVIGRHGVPSHVRA